MRSEFGPVLFVITGGDPLKRPGLDALIRHGAELGLRMTITPSATPLLTERRIDELQAAGIRRMAISIDGADPVTHDRVRGVERTYARSIAALEHARTIGLETQINSAIGEHNEHQLDELAALAGWLEVKLWSVFLLVATGRAGRDMLLDAKRHERLYQHLARIAEDPDCAFDVKTTAGQPFYRVREQRRRRAGGSGDEANDLRRFGLRAPMSVNDGKGICFIDHRGAVAPSGFLPLDCGSIRERPLAELYRGHPTFRALRDPDRLEGKCGRCEFRRLCGGSRSRAYALTGDPLASDPTCVYQPRAAAPA